MTTPRLPDDFGDVLAIENAPARFDEAMAVAEQAAAAGVAILPDPDHAAIFTDPPWQVAGPLQDIGYVVGWDARCYPSPVDGFNYINVSAKLDPTTDAAARGWFRYVAIVHPVDAGGREQMLAQGYGNPFLHHVTWGIKAPERGHDDELSYAARVVSEMVTSRRAFAAALGEKPGTLIAALPEEVTGDPRFPEASLEWVAGLAEDEFQFQAMQDGGYLVQFFVLAGGRIEVALRSGTRQTFNPLSVEKISRDEISTEQDDEATDADQLC